MHDTDEIIVPMAILGAALLLYVGFFTAAREWIQARVSGGKAETAAQSTPGSEGQSGFENPSAGAGSGGGGGGGSVW